MDHYEDNLNFNIECAIINTYFEAELLNIKDKLPRLDHRNFTTSFRRKIVKNINECYDKDKSITLEAMKIVDKCKNTSYEYEVLCILAQNPLTPKMVIDYHRHLTEVRIARDLKVSENY